MKCLFTYEWVKLPRAHIPAGKGLMGSFLRLASRAAFRSGKARYCGYTNDVNAGAWAGGIVGLKSILGIQDRKQALYVMDQLTEMGFITYSLNAQTKKLTYTITDWVVERSGNTSSGGAIYASEGYGFLCMRRCITEKLVEQGYCFCETDAWLDLWCHTVWGDPHNAFSRLAPVVQMARLRPILTLESLGARWGWEKTKVWRFFRKYAGTFFIYKLPGSYGCLLFNQLYPTYVGPMEAPADAAIMRVLKEIRFMGVKTHIEGTDHQRINQYTLWFSKRIRLGNLNNGCPSPCHPAVDRVALWSPYYTRAYSSLPKRKDDCTGEINIGSPKTGLQPSSATAICLAITIDARRNIQMKKQDIASVPERDIYAQQESKLSMQSHAFVQMLAKRGLIEDDAIQNEAVRKADKEKRRNMHHNTLLLLRSYRDIRWMLQCFPDTIAEELDAPLHDLDTLLDLVNAEIDLDNYRLENRIQSMRLSRSMMDRLNEAVSILRDKPQNGDMLYNIIYLTYIAPERLTVVEICSKLHISDRQYYRLRQQALNIISIRLWSAPAAELDSWIEVMSLLEVL